MTHPVSQRGWFDYHYISLQPTKTGVERITVFNQLAWRNIYGEDEEGNRVITGTAPDWRAVKGWSPVMQYVICAGDGEIVDRIPVRGSRRKQVQRAWTRLMVHMMAEP